MSDPHPFTTYLRPSSPFFRLIATSGAVAAVHGVVAMLLLFELLGQGASTAFVAGFLAAQQAAASVAAVGSGFVVDRFGARASAMVGFAATAVVLAFAALAAWQGLFGPALVVGVAVVAAGTGTLSTLGLQAQVRTIGGRFLREATAAWSFVAAAVGVASPLLAGGAIDLFPSEALLAAAAAIVLVGVPAAWTLPSDANRLSKKRAVASMPPAHNAIERRAVGIVFIATVAYSILSMPFEAVYPSFLVATHQVGPSTYGVLASLASLGHLIGIGLSPGVVRRFSWQTAFVGAMVGWGITQAGVAFAPGLMVLALLALLNGLTWGIGSPIELERVQRVAPLEELGRYLGVRAALLGASGPIGATVAALASGFLPATTIMVSSTLVSVAAGVAVAVFLRVEHVRSTRGGELRGERPADHDVTGG